MFWGGGGGEHQRATQKTFLFFLKGPLKIFNVKK
jgi:hypothetical protein